MATALTTRETAGAGATVKNAPLTNAEVDNNFISITNNKLEADNNLSDLTDTAVAKTNLDLASMAAQESDNVSITGGSITGITDLAISDGGTGASTASEARTNLSLGSISTQDNNNVTVTGGTLSNVTLSSSTINNDINGNASTATSFETSRTIFGQSFDGTSDISGNIEFGTQANKATLTYNTDESITLSVPDLAGNRTLAFIDESQTFTNDQLFSDNVRADSLGVGAEASGITGEIRASGNIIANFSDGRLKTNVRNIDSALDKVLSVNGITYDSNELAKKYGFNDTNQVGLIAQEIEKILPQVVRNAPFDTTFDEDGIETSLSGEEYKTIQYDRIVPILIEAIKELHSEIKNINRSRTS